MKTHSPTTVVAPLLLVLLLGVINSIFVPPHTWAHEHQLWRSPAREQTWAEADEMHSVTELAVGRPLVAPTRPLTATTSEVVNATISSHESTEGNGHLSIEVEPGLSGGEAKQPQSQVHRIV